MSDKEDFVAESSIVSQETRCNHFMQNGVLVRLLHVYSSKQ